MQKGNQGQSEHGAQEEAFMYLEEMDRVIYTEPVVCTHKYGMDF